MKIFYFIKNMFRFLQITLPLELRALQGEYLLGLLVGVSAGVYICSYLFSLKSLFSFHYIYNNNNYYYYYYFCAERFKGQYMDFRGHCWILVQHRLQKWWIVLIKRRREAEEKEKEKRR
jgi:hypothetical protein